MRLWYTGGSSGCYSSPVSVGKRPLRWLIRHLKQTKAHHLFSISSVLSWTWCAWGCGGADLIARGLVWLLPKAQAEQAERYAGEQGH